MLRGVNWGSAETCGFGEEASESVGMVVYVSAISFLWLCEESSGGGFCEEENWFRSL